MRGPRQKLFRGLKLIFIHKCHRTPFHYFTCTEKFYFIERKAPNFSIKRETQGLSPASLLSLPKDSPNYEPRFSNLQLSRSWTRELVVKTANNIWVHAITPTGIRLVEQNNHAGPTSKICWENLNALIVIYSAYLRPRNGKANYLEADNSGFLFLGCVSGGDRAVRVHKHLVLVLF